MKAHPHIVVAVLVALLATPDLANATGRVQQPLAVQGEAIRRGENVDVEMRSGAHVLGVVGKVTRDGLYVRPPEGRPLFVAYRDLVAIRDPENGAIVAVPLSVPVPATHRSHDTGWIKPAIVGGIVGFLWILIAISPSG
jgi:hypothetical protein